MIIIHKLEMDMAQRGQVQRMDAVQGDCNTRVLELTLLSDGQPWEVPEDGAVRMRYCKSDGTKGIYDTLPDGSCAWTLAGNIVTMALAPQMLTAAGVVLAQVELLQGTDTLATFTIQIAVERNPAQDALGSEDYINMLQWMEGELDRMLEQAKESGEFDGPQGIQGEPGADVYDYAEEAGYAGTEEEFREMLITPCLPLTGGTMTGPLDMGGQGLSNLPEPVSDSDAVTKFYMDTRRMVSTIILRAAGWTDTAPYRQTVNVPTVLPGDWIRLEPDYTLNLEGDLLKKAALDCISYVNALERQIMAVCLEKKPETDLTVYVESVR